MKISIVKIFGKLQKINSWSIIKAYSILSHAECSVHSRTSKTVRTCYCDLTAIIYLIPAGRLIPLVVTSFPVLSFHNSTLKRLIPSYLAKEFRTRACTRPNSNKGTSSNDSGPTNGKNERMTKLKTF